MQQSPCEAHSFC